MPKYRVLKDVLHPATGRILKEGSEVEIEWPTFGPKKVSSEPTRLDGVLELIKGDKSAAKASADA